MSPLPFPSPSLSFPPYLSFPYPSLPLPLPKKTIKKKKKAGTQQARRVEQQPRGFYPFRSVSSHLFIPRLIPCSRTSSFSLLSYSILSPQAYTFIYSFIYLFIYSTNERTNERASVFQFCSIAPILDTYRVKPSRDKVPGWLMRLFSREH